MYSYRIFRLIIIVFMITYIIACFWWFLVRHINTQEDIEKDNTFISTNKLDEIFSGDADQECYRDGCSNAASDHPCKFKFSKDINLKKNYDEWHKINCAPDILT